MISYEPCHRFLGERAGKIVQPQTAISEEAQSMDTCLDEDTEMGGIQISKQEKRKSLFTLKFCER